MRVYQEILQLNKYLVSVVFIPLISIDLFSYWFHLCLKFSKHPYLLLHKFLSLVLDRWLHAYLMLISFSDSKRLKHPNFTIFFPVCISIESPVHARLIRKVNQSFFRDICRHHTFSLFEAVLLSKGIFNGWLNNIDVFLIIFIKELTLIMMVMLCHIHIIFKFIPHILQKTGFWGFGALVSIG